MKNDDGDNFDIPAKGDPLETADAVARAAHMWLRSLCLNEMRDADERHALAGGLVAGLCDHLALDSRVQSLVAYVYTLLDDEGRQALPVSRKMLIQNVPHSNRHAYEMGRSEARGIIEMLAYQSLRSLGPDSSVENH